MNKGVSKESRINKALDGSYIAFDERSMLDMVLFTLDYSKKVNYYNHKNELDGDWESFFLHDPVFVIAKISATNINQFKKKHDQILFESLGDDSGIRQSKALNNLLEMCYTIMEWDLLFKASDYKGALLKEIDNLRCSVGENLNFIKLGIQKQMGMSSMQRGPYKNFEDFSMYFDLGAIKKSNYYMPARSSLSLEAINETFDHIYGKIVFLKENVSSKFDQKLDSLHNHHPHIGLLLTFIKLFKYVQDDINILTQKHLDFYYKKLLKQKEFTEISYSAMVQMLLEPSVDKMHVDLDAIFNFKLQSQQQIAFSSVSRTELNRAIISDIYTLYKSDYMPFSVLYEENDFAINFLYEADVLAEITNEDRANIGQDLLYPATFGEEGAIFSELGFVVSSPALILEKGAQEIRLQFKVSERSFAAAEAKFDGLVEQEVRQASNQEIEAEDIKKSVISSFFKDAFCIYITNFDGWKEIRYSRINMDQEQRTLNILIPLHALEDQMVSLNTELHEAVFESDWPCIKVLLNNEVQYHPYAFLENLDIESIVVNASVKDVSTLELSNSNGQLDSSIPFTPFGTLPAVGSYLKIQNPIIFQRNLSVMKLHFSWNGLPQGLGGFTEYYKEYPYEIENSKFKAVLNDTRDISELGKELQTASFQLFKSGNLNVLRNENDRTVLLKRFNYNAKIHQIDGEVQPNNSALYLILTNPDVSFGHHVFNEVYADAALKSSRFRRKTIPLPKQPYTPVLDQFSLEYENIAKENMLRKQDEKSSDVKLIHLYPFGHTQAFPGTVKSECYLFPQIKNKGNLFLGLKQVSPGDVVSIGFDMVAAIYTHSVYTIPDVRWEFLANNEWEPMKNLLLEDGTRGLIKTGIVKIRIPSFDQNENSRLPNHAFWIRAVFNSKENLNSRIKNVFTQAILLKSEQEQDTKEVTPEVISKITIVDVQGVQKVSGPFDFKVLKSEETSQNYYARVSEQLRHKNRAVTNWDIERLVIRQFPQIEKVRVYGRNNHPDELVHGSSTQVVLIPKNNITGGVLTRSNMVDYDTLGRVKDYLKSYLPPQVMVEVSNPVYEKLKIRCRVQFSEMEQSGFLRDRLNNELIKYLSPNLENHLKNKGFDERFSKTEILNFIDSQPYVMRVEEFSVLQLMEVMGKHKIIDTQRIKSIEYLRTISAYAILTSAEEHHIEIIHDQYDEGKILGIGDLAIESDFVIIEKGKYN